MFFVKEEGRNTRNTSMRLYRGKPECRTDEVYIAVSSRRRIKQKMNSKIIKTYLGKYS